MAAVPTVAVVTVELLSTTFLFLDLSSSLVTVGRCLWMTIPSSTTQFEVAAILGVFRYRSLSRSFFPNSSLSLAALFNRKLASRCLWNLSDVDIVEATAYGPQGLFPKGRSSSLSDCSMQATCKGTLSRRG